MLRVLLRSGWKPWCRRASWLWLLCLLSGTAGWSAEPAALARQLWDQGQEAMRGGRPDQAIDCYEKCLKLDPTFGRTHLSLAAAYLDKGDEASACPQLAQYLETNPEHLLVRVHYAELLLRLHHAEQARGEFDRIAAEAQDQGEAQLRQLIHCHSRLMEIAQAGEDEYAEHLHRGIGLYLLARERENVSDGENELLPESLLCKAAAELTLARIARPDEAQPCWYLYEVWGRLAQQRTALRCLHEAEEAAPFSYLTPTEHSRLALACRRHTVSSLGK